MGKPAETDRRCLRLLSHSFTLDVAVGVIGPKTLVEHLQEEIATGVINDLW